MPLHLARAVRSVSIGSCRHMCRQSVLRGRAAGPAVSLVRPTLHGVVFAILCPEPAARPALARRRIGRFRRGGAASGGTHPHAGGRGGWVAARPGLPVFPPPPGGAACPSRGGRG